jgi:hypothetical protein
MKKNAVISLLSTAWLWASLPALAVRAGEVSTTAETVASGRPRQARPVNQLFRTT